MTDFSTHEVVKASGNRNRLHTPATSHLEPKRANRNLPAEIINKEKVQKIST